MRNGFNAYLKHFFILATILTVMLVIDEPASAFLLLLFMGYFGVLFLGIFFRKGPLKNIGMGFLRDRKDELEELKPPKQPWE